MLVHIHNGTLAECISINCQQYNQTESAPSEIHAVAEQLHRYLFIPVMTSQQSQFRQSNKNTLIHCFEWFTHKNCTYILICIPIT